MNRIHRWWSAVTQSKGDQLPDPPAELEVEEEEDPEAIEKRRRMLILLFSHLKGTTKHRLEQFTDQLAEGGLTIEEWSNAFRSELQGAHAEAALIGRRLAGEVSPMSALDLRYGAAVWDEQEGFFQKFVDDLERGRYGEPNDLRVGPIKSRSAKYVKRLRGTVHEAWLDEIAESGQLIDWIDVGDERECGDCPKKAKEGPYRTDELDQVPGDGKTQCQTECRCYLRTQDGRYSTEGI